MTHHLKAEREHDLLATFDKRPQAVSVAWQASPSEFVEITDPSQVDSLITIPVSSLQGFTLQAQEIRKSRRLFQRPSSPKNNGSN